MQQGLHTALVSPDDWTWHLKFRIPGSLNFTFSKQTTDSSLKALWSYQRPCKLLFFFFSSPLTPPQPSGLTCRRDLLYLHHPCPPPVWVAIPLWTQAAITVVEFWPQIAPFLLPNWASWVLLSCTKPELTGPVLTHCPELGQGGKPGETKGTWEGKGDSRGSLI